MAPRPPTHPRELTLSSEQIGDIVNTANNILDTSNDSSSSDSDSESEADDNSVMPEVEDEDALDENENEDSEVVDDPDPVVDITNENKTDSASQSQSNSQSQLPKWQDKELHPPYAKNVNKPSKAWKFGGFEKNVENGNLILENIVCGLCGKKIKYRQTPTNFTEHLQTHHKAVYFQSECEETEGTPDIQVSATNILREEDKEGHGSNAIVFASIVSIASIAIAASSLCPPNTLKREHEGDRKVSGSPGNVNPGREGNVGPGKHFNQEENVPQR